MGVDDGRRDDQVAGDERDEVMVSFPQLEAEPPTLNWEYLTLVPDRALTVVDIENALNTYGADGWEISAVHFPKHGHVLMKRPVWTYGKK